MGARILASGEPGYPRLLRYIHASPPIVTIAGGESLEMSIVGASWIVCTTAGGLKPDVLASLRHARERGIEVTIGVHGPYSSVLNFVNGLQTGKRLFLVTGILSAKDADSGSENVVAAKVTGLIYVLKPGQ